MEVLPLRQGTDWYVYAHAEALHRRGLLGLAGRERAELIDGELYDMAPPSKMHQKIDGGLTWALTDFTKRNGGPCEVCPAPFAVNLNADIAVANLLK